MDQFKEVAQNVVIYRLRSSWLEIAKLYSSIASEFNGTLPEGFLLLSILESDGCPISIIAPRMTMSPKQLSNPIKQLIQKGYITQKINADSPEDTLYQLTPKGSEMREVAFKAVFRLENAFKEEISEEKLTTFFEVLSAMPDVIGKHRERLSK